MQLLAKWIYLIVIVLVLAACSSVPTEEVVEIEPTLSVVEEVSMATSEPFPTNTAVLPSVAPEPEIESEIVEVTSLPEPSPTSEPESTPPPEPAFSPDPLFPIGSTANWTETADLLGIEGEIEFLSSTQLTIRNFVFLAAEAPGVDIRLGVGDDFSDEVAVSLKDITGKTYEDRNLTLTIPSTAFDGRAFDSIGVICYDTGDLFDWAPIVME